MAPAATRMDVYAAIREHIDNLDEKDADRAFFVADLAKVRRQVARWRRGMPWVTPYYAVKSNPEERLLKELAALGVKFDCASEAEIATVLQLGVSPQDVVFANPFKAESALRYAAEVGVLEMTFDTRDELEKIAARCPEARLMVRIAARDSTAIVDLGAKFGAAMEDVDELLVHACNLGLAVEGVAFHVGSGARDAKAYIRAIRDARDVIDRGRSLGLDMNQLDIGGGFQDENFEDLAEPISRALSWVFADMPVRLMAEPGRFFSSSAYKCVTRVIGRRVRKHEGIEYPGGMLYQSDGVFGAFMNALIEGARWNPVVLPRHEMRTRSRTMHLYRIWGPTCDSTDSVQELVELPCEVLVGDYLVYDNMGAYTLATCTRFNGFGGPYKVLYLD